MNALRIIHSRRTRILLASVLLLAAGGPAAEGATSGSPGGSSAVGFVSIATGPDPNVDGFLSVSPDDFGQWASTAFGGGGDIFNPTGAPAPLAATFSSALFLFVPSQSQRIVLTENPNHLAIADDGSLSLAVISPLVPSDTDKDGVDDTLVSSFSVTGTVRGGVADLVFDLTQFVASLGQGIAVLEQVYLITNTGPSVIDLVLVRVYDGDLIWDGEPGNEFANDQVGTSWHLDGGEPFVFMQEASNPEPTSIILSSPDADAYFGGKHGVQPENGPPPYDFGTDTEVFDAFGIPASWVNHIAGVGYSTDGVSGPAPPGSVPPEDGFIGLGFSGLIFPGETVSIVIRHTYGKELPLPAYVRSTVGPPWGAATNEAAMDDVFGVGDWDDLRYETLFLPDLLSPNREFIFMEGSDNNADEMEAFLGASLDDIQDWVLSGGALLMNAAPNEGDGMNYGFGGVTLTYKSFGDEGNAVDPSHPIFNGPFTPITTNYTGGSFAHAFVAGGGVVSVINNENLESVLAEKNWGAGRVAFGGMTTDNFHAPQPEAANLRRNIIDHVVTGSIFNDDFESGDMSAWSGSVP